MSEEQIKILDEEGDKEAVRRGYKDFQEWFVKASSSETYDWTKNKVKELFEN